MSGPVIYTEKGHGLHELVAAAGHWLMCVDGEWIASDPAAVQAIIDQYSLDACKTARCREIERHAKAKRDAIVADISAAEMASWSIKRAEAAAFDGSDASAPTLAMEAAARGVTTAEIVSKVSTQAAALAALEAQIAGVSGRHRDAVRALPDFAAVMAYDFSGGWPV